MHSSPNNAHPAASPRLAVVLLGLVLLLGGLLRFSGRDWGEKIILHPDEYFVSDVTARLSSVGSLTAYFDTSHSTLNPNNVGKDFYVYGTLPVILTRISVERLQREDMWDLLLLGRALSAVADWVVVLLVFLCGKRLFDVRIGLLGAFLYALSGLPIQQSHFYTVDTSANLFSTAAFYFAVRIRDSRRPWLDAMVFGICLGMGMASKITVIAVASMLVLALLIRWSQESGLLAGQENVAKEGKALLRSPLVRAFSVLILAGVITALSFRVFQPYAFLPPHSGIPRDESASVLIQAISDLADPVGFRPNPKWLAQMNEASFQGSGKWDAPPNYQWLQRTRFLFPLWNIIAVGLGWPLGISAWLAVLWAIWEIFRRNPGYKHLLLPTAWVLLLFIWQGSRWVMTMRYFLPIYPHLTLLAAWAPITMWDRVQSLLAKRHAPRAHPASLLPIGAGLIITFGGLTWGIAVAGMYHRPITRVAASHWIVENVPSDVTFIMQTSQGERPFQYGLPNEWTPDGQHYTSIAYTLIQDGASRSFPLAFPYTGRLAQLRLNHIASLQSAKHRLHVQLVDLADSSIPLVDGTIEADFYTGNRLQGDSYEIVFEPVEVSAERAYQLILTLDPGPPLVFSSDILVDEGSWDWPVPFSIAPYNLWDVQYQSYSLDIVFEDSEDKRERLLYILDQADYLTISSNRFYATLNRDPARWPMTITYYQALFSGKLGFDLVADFTSRPRLGPIEFCDDHAEEAWTVYDHPRVFVFHKSAQYDPIHVEQILHSVEIGGMQRADTVSTLRRPVPLQPPGTCLLLNLVGNE